MRNQNLISSIRIARDSRPAAEPSTLEEQYAAAHGYTIKDAGRRPRVEHHGASDPLAA